MSNEQQGDDCSIAIGTSVTGSAIVPGDNNTVTITNTEIIQISADKIKTDQLITASPYKGLKPFEPNDSDRFFGRDQFLRELVSELEQTNFILLLGASGSGKSSVLKAGLIPLLQKNRVDNFDSLIFTPDLDPFESLYKNLPRRYKQSETQIARVCSDDTLSQVVNQLKPPNSFWLIFIDQFEELFTLSKPDKRDHFIASLIKLSQEQITDPLIKIVVTMRADFLDQLDPFPANQLASLTQKHRPLITQMHPDELRQAIEQPAAHHGIVFETGLVEIIIKQVQGQAGYLPLLQYTLNLLWEQESQRNEFDRERTLRTQTYLDLGGVRGALQQHVDQIYESLSEQEQIAAQRIFLKLVEIGGDELAGTEWKPVRRRAARSEFSEETEKTVLTQLINHNLLVSDAPVTGSEQRQLTLPNATVEIAHEILLTSWETLNTWIKENRQAIALRNRLYDDVRLWLKEGKRDDELWNGAKLEQVNKLRADATFNQVAGSLSPDAVDFINASNSLSKRKMQERIAAGDDRRSALMELLESCTVRLSISGQDKVSTGFFIAPGKILTSAPEIVGAGEQPIRVDWQDQENFSKATIDQVFQSNHLAILKLSSPASHPCVYLDKTFQINDPFCTYGYSNQLAKDGYGVGNCQKQTGRQVIEFKTHQNSLELQSSALLNWKTRKVCGIVQSTHDRVSVMPDQDDVTIGKATSAATILTTVQDLKKEQRAFHQKDRRWSNLFPPRCKPRTVALASLGMTALVVLVRSFQVFQPLELFSYDAMMRGRLKPPEPSNRFLIVTVTKENAEAQEKRGEVLTYSLSNDTLKRLLKRVEDLNPLAVGLDIYREQTLSRLKPSERQSLETYFQKPNLFAVCKGEYEKDEGIAPPPDVSLKQVGFSDITLDDGGILRRQLLAFSKSNAVNSKCQSTKSFSLLIAERYLQRMANIQTDVKVSEKGCQINFRNGINDISLPNLQPNTGGYQGYSRTASDRFNGCQILLNYRDYREQQENQRYKTVTLEEFLNSGSLEDYKDRIVLIGIDRSDGFYDNVRTPYDQGADDITPGVIVQAQMIDQIIDVATSKSNSLIWVLPSGVYLLLILIAALMGGGLGWYAQSSRQLGIIVAASDGSVLIISLVIFQFGGWVPLMPHFLALSATSGYVFWANMRLRSGVSANPVKPLKPAKQ